MIENTKVPGRVAAFLATTVLLACTGITGPPLSSGVQIEVQVSGGIAGVVYSFEVSGRDRVVRGLTCENGCDFQAGEVLLPLSVTQIQDLAEDMEATGILGLDGTDFGAPCCDDFEFVVTYDNGSDAATIRGSSQALPPDLQAAVQVLLGMANGTVPVVVDLQGSLTNLPRDGVSLGPVTISGDVLEAELSFGGGCASHEIDLVAFNGWLESFPIQVSLFFSHEDNDDPCDAFLTQMRTFDLRRLANEYNRTYSVAGPGLTTLILRIEDVNEPGGFRAVNYVF